MKYEATLLNGIILYVNTENETDALKLAGKTGPVSKLRKLIEDSYYLWEEVYTRKYQDVIAYVNAWYDDLPLGMMTSQLLLFL